MSIFTIWLLCFIPFFQLQTSIINGTSIYAEDYLLSNIFQSYVSRNLTTYLHAPYTIWSSGRAAGQPFVLSATIAYPEEVYTYTPGFWFLIKWGWVQYVSVLLLFLFVFDRIKIFIYSNQLVNTIVTKPWRNEIKMNWWWILIFFNWIHCWCIETWWR